MAGARFTIGTSQATMVSDDNPIPTTDANAGAAPTLNHAAVTVTTGATLILALNANRASLSVYNNGAATVYVGNSGVTTATGMPIPAGAEREVRVTGALYGIVASGTVEVRYLEETR